MLRTRVEIDFVDDDDDNDDDDVNVDDDDGLDWQHDSW